MTPTCARCGETHDDDAPLCALCAARVALDNAEVDFEAWKHAVHWHHITGRISDYLYHLNRTIEARATYDALCLASWAVERV